jgi:hypothetical protein
LNRAFPLELLLYFLLRLKLNSIGNKIGSRFYEPPGEYYIVFTESKVHNFEQFLEENIIFVFLFMFPKSRTDCTFLQKQIINLINSYHKTRSLDSVYHYGGQNVPFKKCILKHTPEKEDEIELKFGDIIRYYPENGAVRSSNLWNGYSLGINTRTKKKGLFPTYKTKELVQTF